MCLNYVLQNKFVKKKATLMSDELVKAWSRREIALSFRIKEKRVAFSTTLLYFTDGDHWHKTL